MPMMWSSEGSNVGEDAVGGFGVCVLGNVYKRHGVERVGCIGCAVGVDSVVGVAVVGDDDYFVAVFLGSLYSVVQAGVEGFDSFRIAG